MTDDHSEAGDITCRMNLSIYTAHKQTPDLCPAGVEYEYPAFNPSIVLVSLRRLYSVPPCQPAFTQTQV